MKGTCFGSKEAGGGGERSLFPRTLSKHFPRTFSRLRNFSSPVHAHRTASDIGIEKWNDFLSPRRRRRRVRSGKRRGGAEEEWRKDGRTDRKVAPPW